MRNKIRESIASQVWHFPKRRISEALQMPDARLVPLSLAGVLPPGICAGRFLPSCTDTVLALGSVHEMTEG